MFVSDKDVEVITSFLTKEKERGYSSPSGRYWDNFYKMITKNVENDRLPSLPLILGGSIASNADKQERLCVLLDK
jgi:hypothetical protein